MSQMNNVVKIYKEYGMRLNLTSLLVLVGIAILLETLYQNVLGEYWLGAAINSSAVLVLIWLCWRLCIVKIPQ